MTVRQQLYPLTLLTAERGIDSKRHVDSPLRIVNDFAGCGLEGLTIDRRLYTRPAESSAAPDFAAAFRGGCGGENLGIVSFSAPGWGGSEYCVCVHACLRPRRHTVIARRRSRRGNPEVCLFVWSRCQCGGT